MPKYVCECCEFETDRKSNYDKHIKSSKHLSKLNQPSSSTNISVTSVSSLGTEEFKDSSKQSAIVELEYQLKLKDIEIQNIINEYTLKLQMKDNEIKHKDELIAMLRHQTTQQPQQPLQQQTAPVSNHFEPVKQNNINMVIHEKTTNQQPKQESTLDMLKRERKDAITIEEFIDDYLFTDNNPYIYIGELDNKDYILPVNIKKNDYKSQFLVTQICKTFETIPKQMSPIFCSDERRHKFYILTNDGWIKSNEEESINKIITNLVFKSAKVISQAFLNIFDLQARTDINFKNFFKKKYNMPCEVFMYDHKPELTSKLLYDKTLIDKLKIALSTMTSSKSKKYVPESEPEPEPDDCDESDYDCEKDPDPI